MEQDNQRLAGLAIDEIDIDEVAVRRIPSFTAESDPRLADAGRGIDGLHMAAGQPAWSRVVDGRNRHQCECTAVPGLTRYTVPQYGHFPSPSSGMSRNT